MRASTLRLPDRQAGLPARQASPPPAAPLPPPVVPLTRPPPEEELVRLWHGQHLPPDALATRRGEPLRVIYRGRRSSGPGPDFRDAVIEGPDRELRHGDVEVHVRSSSFRHHGHSRDPAYDGVVLHLVWEDDEGEDTLLPCGRRVAVVALAPWFQRRREELARLLRQPDAWREPCFSALARLGPEAVGDILDRLGDLRFRQKTEGFRRALSGSEAADQVLYAAVLEALGYGGHREAFARLAHELPYRRLRGGRRTAARRRSRSPPGDDPPRRRRPHPSCHARRLATALPAAGQPSSPPARWGGPSPGAGAVGAGGLRPRASLGTDPSPAAAIRAWTVTAANSASPALVGRGRAIEILVNAVLPFLAAGGDGAEGALQEQALGLFRRLPAAGSYGVTAHLERALALPRAGRLTGSARRQQGLLWLLHCYCRQGGCAQAGTCPLS